MTSSARRRNPMVPVRPIGLAITVGLLLVGCGKHYWNKVGAGPADFTKDSNECARENSVQMSSDKEYAIVVADLYRACLKRRGWGRAQQFDPPPPDWFRGIEDDGPVRLEPPAGPRSDLPAVPSELAADLVGTWAGQLMRPSTTGRRSYPALLHITEERSRLRGSLEVGGFGRRALPISFTLAVNGSALEASGLGADNTLYRLALQRR